MARMNWSKAKRLRDPVQTPEQRAMERRANMWLSQPSKPSRSRPKLKRKPAYRAPPIEWPCYVTDGMQADGTLRVLTFNSREEADAAGFQWVNRA